jgi:hypothetical protein
MPECQKIQNQPGCKTQLQIGGSTSQNKSKSESGYSTSKGVGQHPRTVGQHKTEWWVNMEQNLHSTSCLIRLTREEAKNQKAKNASYDPRNTLRAI